MLIHLINNAHSLSVSNTTHDGPLASTISTLTFTSFQTAFDNQTALDEALTDLDTWINSGSPTGLASQQYEIQKQWINESLTPGMEFVMIPMGGFTKTHPANDTSYLTVAAILEHPFSRGSVVRAAFRKVIPGY
jgi:hypothetical protein